MTEDEIIEKATLALCNHKRRVHRLCDLDDLAVLDVDEKDALFAELRAVLSSVGFFEMREALGKVNSAIAHLPQALLDVDTNDTADMALGRLWVAHDAVTSALAEAGGTDV